MPELILSLRERELARFSILAVHTTIGRDAGCDVVIDNAGISRLHATIDAVGDSFVLRDCESENGLTLNGEPCREGRLVHDDIVGLNKFLLRFSNQALEVPSNLRVKPNGSEATRPKDVQRTMHVDAEAAQALVAQAKKQIAQKRAEIAARDGDSMPPLPPSGRVRPRESLRWEEPPRPRSSLTMILGAFVVLGVLIASLLLLQTVR
jgi:pSer/pThr/pTyr-binding forkhead associated (FHA) protein